MATPTTAVTSSFNSLGKGALLLVGVVALYFAYTYVLPYSVWNEQSYGYYWPNRLPLAAHATGGLLALLAGVFQLWSGFNGRAMSTHPLTGRVYLAGVLVGSLGALVLSFTSHLYGFAWGVGLFSLATAWLAITLMALLCIKRRKIRPHKQWMVRSYILTFAFVTFRIATDYIPAETLWNISAQEMAVAMIWPVWVLPLLAYEVYLQYQDR